MSVLVTVGTTSFDQLIQQACKLEFHTALLHLGYRHVQIQYGSGQVIPKLPDVESNTNAQLLSLETFTFKPDLSSDISSADLVISHGGSGTCLQALTPPGARRLIIVINDTLAENHQEDLALTLARGRHAVATKPENLISLLRDGVTETTSPFPGIPFKYFSPSVVDLLGPQLPPEKVGFVGFQRGNPSKLRYYLDAYFDSNC